MSDVDAIRRIKPADVPFSPGMTSAQVEYLAGLSAFDDLDQDFRDSASFRKILRSDSRIERYQDGDIIVREGDWENTAFLVLSGTVVVELEPPERGLPDEMLGRRKPQRKGIFQSLAQLWSNHRMPEFRGRQSYVSEESRIGTRGKGENTRIFLQDVPGVMDRYRTKQLGPGSLFGELSALGRTARTATVFASGKVDLLEIRWQGLRDLMRRDAGMRKRIDDNFREHALMAFLQNSPLFQHLVDDEKTKARLIQDAKLESYGEYDQAGSFKSLAESGIASNLENEALVAGEGDYPNGVIIVRSGLARVSRRHHHGHQTLSYLSPGQMFGFEEIEEAWQTSQSVPLRHSLRAIGYLTVVTISTRVIERYLLKKPEESSLSSRKKERRKKDQPVPSIQPAMDTKAPDAKALDQEFLEFLVQEQFANGRATMLIDMDRCTRCDDCVKACASAHDNNPRFLRHGPIHGNIMVANACMHCQDPVCMIECPTGAISRRLDEGEVAINDDTCIGCSNCSKNCPYDAIRMVEIRDKKGWFVRDQVASSRAPITKATKCDLCVDQLGGPACQRACPHDALVRMDMSNIAALSMWHQR